MRNSKIIVRALVNSLGVFAYVVLVALIMMNGEKLFGGVDSIWTGVSFLLLFVLSAFVVGLILLGQPVFWYLDSKKKESVKLLVASVIFLVLITATTMVVYSIAR